MRHVLVMLLISVSLLAATSAAAVEIVWTSNQANGTDIGPTATEVSATQTLSLAGFIGGLATDMVAKQVDPSDHGLGLLGGPATEIGFITLGDEIVVTLPSAVTCPCDFKIESLDVGETFTIQTTGNILIASGGADPATPGIATVTTSLLPPDRTFIVAAGDAASSVLLDEVSATAAVPEPASLLLVGTGLVGLGYKARRRLTS